MHIPDGMLDAKTWTTTWVGGAAAVGYASTWARRNFDQSRIVLMASLAALTFALQMLNIPVAGGTSGHFGGGVLAALILGPWPAVLVMTAVLAIQAVLFGDGGITTLGANILALGVVAPFLGWWIHRLVTRASDSLVARGIGAFVGAWVGAVACAALVAVFVWASGNAALMPILGAMTFWHAIIGVIEGAITVGVVTYIAKVRPGLLERGSGREVSLRSVTAVLLVVALIAVGLSFLASSHPDGLEFAYFETGIGRDVEMEHTIVSPLADYFVPALGETAISGVAAGFVGLVVTIAIVAAVMSVLRRRGSNVTGDER